MLYISFYVNILMPRPARGEDTEEDPDSGQPHPRHQDARTQQPPWPASGEGGRQR